MCLKNAFPPLQKILRKQELAISAPQLIWVGWLSNSQIPWDSRPQPYKANLNSSELLEFPDSISLVYATLVIQLASRTLALQSFGPSPYKRTTAYSDRLLSRESCACAPYSRHVPPYLEHCSGSM
jgi:hypothetical protein